VYPTGPPEAEGHILRTYDLPCVDGPALGVEPPGMDGTIVVPGVLQHGCVRASVVGAMLLAMAPLSGAIAQTSAPENSICLMIESAARDHGLPFEFFARVIWQESRFQIGARSPVGAFGLTQIMPATASDLGINPAYYDDPYLQVTGGARYLAQMLNMFDGNIIHALAAYNAGPGNVQNYGGVPPFAETQHYVVVIPQQYNSYLAAVGGIDALGTIDPVLLANASFSLSAHGAGVYGDYSLVSVRAAALRVQDIITRIGETEDLHEAIALNTYARAELARLVAIRTRIKAAHTQPLSEEQLAMAAAQAAERQFMDFTLESLR